MSQEDHTGAWIGIGIGILIGGLFAFLIMREKPAQPPQTMQGMDMSIFRQFTDDIRRLSEENATLKSQLPLIRQFPAVTQAADTPISPQVPISPQTPVPTETTAYKNKEKWVIVRSADHIIQGLEVIRDVKLDATGAAG